MLGAEVVAISNATAIVLLFIEYRDAKLFTIHQLPRCERISQGACCQHGTSRAAFLAQWVRVEFLRAGAEFKLTA